MNHMPGKIGIQKQLVLAICLMLSVPGISQAWHDKTHLAIAKAAGYGQWYNAAGADIAKVKAGNKETYNHFSDNPPGTVVTPRMILDQIRRYDDPNDEQGHLYGAIVASIRDYRSARATGKYAEYYLAYCVHYVGDLSMPLHNTLFDPFNQKYHAAIDGVVEDEVLDHLERIRIYTIKIGSEDDLLREIARIANLSMKKGYELKEQDRPLTREEAYDQLSHSASLLKAILEYLK